MWAIFGVSAIAAALLSVITVLHGKDGKPLAFVSLALTAFTLCAFYGQVENWVLCEDWSALMDVVPGMTRALWFLAGASIVINSIAFLRKGNSR